MTVPLAAAAVAWGRRADANPHRLTRALRRRADLVWHRGTAVRCPLCGGRFDRFKPAWNRPDALCWRCGAHERHRAQWLLLSRHPELLGTIRSLLHFAPEWTMRERLAPLARERGIRYLTADLDPTGVDRQLDITGLDLPDNAFDAVMCSHVLEHVPDDAAAMRELRRVTAPGGWCLVMVPLDLTRARTYEDQAVTTPEAREHEFLQNHDELFPGHDVAAPAARATAPGRSALREQRWRAPGRLRYRGPRRGRPGSP